MLADRLRRVTRDGLWIPEVDGLRFVAIFSVLLPRYEFALTQPHDTYRNDHTKMVVQLDRPAKVRYRKRTS